jgi:hypothetical protein
VNPYRELPEPELPEPVVADREDRVLYTLLVLIGTIPVALAVKGGGGFDVQATLGLVMAALGLAGLVTTRRIRPPA